MQCTILYSQAILLYSNQSYSSSSVSWADQSPIKGPDSSRKDHVINLYQMVTWYGCTGKLSVEWSNLIWYFRLDRWYHGMLSRVQAETVLRPHSEGSYLVRQVFPTSNSSSNSSEASGRQDGSRESGNFSRSSQDLGSRMDYSLAIKYVLNFIFYLQTLFSWVVANVFGSLAFKSFDIIQIWANNPSQPWLQCNVKTFLFRSSRGFMHLRIQRESCGSNYRYKSTNHSPFKSNKQLSNQ